MTDSAVKLQGDIAKTVLKPPKISEEGELEKQEEMEILLRIPTTEMVRSKLPAISRLMEATVVIEIASLQGTL